MTWDGLGVVGSPGYEKDGPGVGWGHQESERSECLLQVGETVGDLEQGLGGVGGWELWVSLLPVGGSRGAGQQEAPGLEQVRGTVWKPGWAPGMHKDGPGAGGQVDAQ